MKTEIYGHYKSNNVLVSGCVKEFLTRPREAESVSSGVFKSQYDVDCDLCGKYHTFNLNQTMYVNTPSHRNGLMLWADNNGVSVDYADPPT